MQKSEGNRIEGDGTCRWRFSVMTVASGVIMFWYLQLHFIVNMCNTVVACVQHA